MADQKLSQAIRTASAVNLRYSADLLNLGRDYIKAFAGALTQAAEEDKPPQTQPAPGRAAAAAPPRLLVAGYAGETANAAFVLNGSAKTQGTISLVVSGDFGDSKVTVEPEQITLGSETETIVRIVAKIGRKMEPGVDHVGAVTIPELGHEVTQFVLRKLDGK